uniref:Apolipoprotein A-IV a n=1 Tax=Electrophorus electricus TaxID=8005 RepID=A0AAY5EY70_ELEEL
MKVVVILILAVFTGCQANIFYADEPKPQLEQLTGAFWDYVAQATHTAEDTLKMIQESQLGQEVKYVFLLFLQYQMHPLAQDIVTKISKEAEVLKVEDLRVAVAPYADSLDSQSLKATILQKTEELRESVEEKVQGLQSQLEPYTTDLKQRMDQHLEDFQQTIVPLTEDLQTQIAERTALVQQSLAPYAEDLKEKLDPYAQNLKDQLMALYESFSKTS